MGGLRVHADCPEGEHILGGGYEITVSEGRFPNNFPVVRVNENRPFRETDGPDSWIVSGINQEASARDEGTLIAYAVCTKSTGQ